MCRLQQQQAVEMNPHTKEFPMMTCWSDRTSNHRARGPDSRRHLQSISLRAVQQAKGEAAFGPALRELAVQLARPLAEKSTRTFRL